ncbi:Transcriptional regulator, AcrR family [hydrothermal vent metagenome]|uniref:Transcriptional regulator, AcrR family n=1 Tax=hydrothermal vent metagenome TaxID=652676 RepID=A0A3B0U3Q9_9ZZZZ
MSDHPSMKMKPEKRSALFAAAAHEFTEHGFERASLNRIISTLKMSKSSFYHYFASKSDLFQQIMVQAFAPLNAVAARFEPQELNANNFWPELLHMAEIASAMAQEAPEIISAGRMFYRNLDDEDGLCAKMMEFPLALTTRLLEHGQKLGVIRHDLPLPLLISSVMALGMALDRWGLENFTTLDGAEISRLNEQGVDLFKRVLTP